jgi:hypothetical protein
MNYNKLGEILMLLAATILVFIVCYARFKSENQDSINKARMIGLFILGLMSLYGLIATIFTD